MSKLDQPLKLKHGLAAAVAIMAISITGTAIAGGGGGGGGGNFHYVQDFKRNVNANSQAHKRVLCPQGTKVVGGGAASSAGFAGGGGMMINSSFPLDTRDPDNREDDGWAADVDVFADAGGENLAVYAICRG